MNIYKEYRNYQIQLIEKKSIGFNWEDCVLISILSIEEEFRRSLPMMLHHVTSQVTSLNTKTFKLLRHVLQRQLSQANLDSYKKSKARLKHLRQHCFIASYYSRWEQVYKEKNYINTFHRFIEIILIFTIFFHIPPLYMLRFSDFFVFTRKKSVLQIVLPKTFFMVMLRICACSGHPSTTFFSTFPLRIHFS